MKRSYLLIIKATVATLSIAVFLCACSDEIHPGGDDAGEIATVTLSVNPVAGEPTLTTKGMTPDQENAIRTLYILAFRKDGSGTFRLKYYEAGSPASGGNGKFTFSLRCSVSGAADTKLLLIANHNPFTQVTKEMTYAEVQAALKTGELDAAPAFADTGIPMFGFAGNSADTPLLITKGMQLSANLLRAVARVDVGVGTYNTQNGDWNKGSVSFTLTDVFVFKPQNKYSFAPLIDNLEYDVNGTPSVTSPSPAGTLGSTNFQYTEAAITGGTSCKAEIYIPEVAFGGGKVYDANHEARTALVIGGIYNGMTKKTYYRIDFTTAQTNTEGDILNDILRNHIYRFSITNVSLAGYATPQAAYSGRAVGLNFSASIDEWVAGVTGSPDPDMMVRLNFGGINGTIVTGPAGTVLPKRTDYFVTDDGRTKGPLDYNKLLGEASDNTYNGVTNGGIYKSAEDAFKREGPYNQLVIAPDNVGDFVWKTGTTKKDRVLVAKQACRDYRGQGLSEWRLPRVSELYLIWLNRVTINQSKGFTSLGESGVTFWSGSEGSTAGGEIQAFTINAAGEVRLAPKSESHSIRCVRQVR